MTILRKPYNTEQQKYYYDQRAKAQPFPELQTGQNVRVHDIKSGVWNPGYITEKLSQLRSYTVKTNKGTYRRKHLHATNEQFTEQFSHDQNENSSETENIQIETDNEQIDTPPTQSQNTAENTDTDSHDKVYMTRSGHTIHKPSRFDC
jgi:hypothetical protein